MNKAQVYYGIVSLINPVLLICSLNLLFDMKIEFSIWTYSSAFCLIDLLRRIFPSSQPVTHSKKKDK